MRVLVVSKFLWLLVTPVMPKERSTTRKECCKDNYLTAKASRSNNHTPVLQQSFDDESHGRSSDEACCKCFPVFGHYKVQFEQLVHQGSTCKTRKSRNPHPKRVDTQPYRDLNTQNTWLRSNVFDAMGNYMFCGRCIRAVFLISPQRLARQKQIKQSEFQQPTKEMTKVNVE